MIKSCARCTAYIWKNMCSLGYGIEELPNEKTVFWKLNEFDGVVVSVKPKFNCPKPLTKKQFNILYGLKMKSGIKEIKE